MSNAALATPLQAGLAYSDSQRSILDEVLNSTTIDDEQKQIVGAQIDTLIRQILGKQVQFSKSIATTIQSAIKRIDELLNVQINEVLHNEAFQKLESSWRGLRYLIFETETSPMLKVRVLNASQAELLKDLRNASEFDQSSLYKKIYSRGFDTFNGIPYGALLGDYEFGRHPDDVELLGHLSRVAAAAHAPFLSAASPKLFDMRSFTALPEERDLAKIFDETVNPQYVKWKEFRKSPDSRYVALVAPHMLMRLPYGPDSSPVTAFNFQEDVTQHNKYLWGNAAYALALRLTTAFAQHGWHMAICGLEGGGQVQGLPVHTFKTDAGSIAMKCPTEVVVTERRAGELIRLGVIPLVVYENTDYAVFIDAPSCQLPATYNDPKATANAALSADLRCILAASRFTHYLKAITRDKLGSFLNAKECEDFLHRWIVSNYTVANTDATQAIKSSKPLREAAVSVSPIPGRPGYFAATINLAPHIPFKGLSASVSMVAELPPPARS